MKKRSLTALLCVMLAVPFLSGCGKDKNAYESSTSATEPETTTAATETTSEEDTTGEKETTSESDGIWMHTQGNANTMAAGIRMDSAAFFYQLDPLPKIVYSHIQDESDFGKDFVSQHKSIGDQDIEYLMFLNDDGFADFVMCWICSYDKNIVGCGGRIEIEEGILSEVDTSNWDEVLAYFGLKAGEYTYIYPDEAKEIPTAETLNKEDPDVNESCILAYSLAQEYELDYSGEAAVYGVRRKDEEFIRYVYHLWDIPYHGDIEYIMVFDNTVRRPRIFCWDMDRDKKYVGDSELGECGDNIATLGWDKVLEKYGFKQGDYTK